MFTLNIKRLSAIAATGLLMVLSQTALAAGTASGTAVTNNVAVNYEVGGVPQPPENAPPVTFNVDSAVNVNVSASAGINVAPGAANQVLQFTVTNNGNSTQGYALEQERDGTSNFTSAANNVRIYINNNCLVPGTWDSTNCDEYTQGANNNAFAGDLDADELSIVWIVSDIPTNGGGTAPTDGQVDTYNLLARTLDSGTAFNAVGTDTVDNSLDAWSALVLQVVFREGVAGNHSLDADDDGQDSNSATYTASSAALVVTKTQDVANDGQGAVSPNAKAIPGATVTYTISLVNSGGADATALSVADTLPAGLTYTPNTTDITITGVPLTDTNMTDGNPGANTGAVADIAGQVLTVNTFTVPFGETVTITFDTTID